MSDRLLTNVTTQKMTRTRLYGNGVMLFEEDWDLQDEPPTDEMIIESARDQLAGREDLDSIKTAYVKKVIVVTTTTVEELPAERLEL